MCKKNEILTIAISLSIKVGYTSITRAAIAREAKISDGLVNRYFGTMTKLKKVVIKTAIEKQIPEIILQGFLLGDPLIKSAPRGTVQKAFNSIL